MRSGEQRRDGAVRDGLLDSRAGHGYLRGALAAGGSAQLASSSLPRSTTFPGPVRVRTRGPQA